MSDNQERIDELMRKLDLLLAKQEAFSEEVNSLKSEIRQLIPQKEAPKKIEPITSRVSPSVKVAKPGNDWPKLVELEMIKTQIGEHTEGVTSGGNKFVKFTIERNDKIYRAFFSSNSNWALETESSMLLARGRFKDDGRVLNCSEGPLEGMEISNEDIIENLVKAGRLDRSIVTADTAKKVEKAAPKKVIEQKPAPPRTKSSIERYIGENLINVIGIVIVLIGVVFGVKYSIDHELINPTTRIFLGYLLGIGILVTGMKLKKKYEQFSAVLVSGAMAIMYFVTFIAYSLYGLFPKMATFVIMLIFTVFTVVSAIHYNRQIIAHIGLVGSYAVPFLLSDGSGNVMALFIYMAIINAGILVIAFKKHWKPLYYVAFGATWLIYLLWFATSYYNNQHFGIALTFAALFFVMFYATFMVYKLIEKEKFAQEDVFMIVLNSAIFYGVSYMVLDGNQTGRDYIGLFTVGTAIIHFIVSIILFKSKLADRNLFYLSSGMVLVFITIAIPVQLDGNWVTLLWALEGALLFWIGRTKSVRFYEVLSYVVMGIAFFSFLEDYTHVGYDYSENVAFKNMMFLTTLMLSASYGFVLFINSREKYQIELKKSNPETLKVVSVALTALVIGLVYNMFRTEFSLIGDYLYYASSTEVPQQSGNGEIYSRTFFDEDIRVYQRLWILNYTLLFVIGLTLLNVKRIKNNGLGLATLILNTFGVLLFLVVGLFGLSELRESFIEQPNAEAFTYSYGSIRMRYISYLFVGGSLYSIFLLLKTQFKENKEVNMVFDLLKHLTFLWIIASELINWMDLSGSDGSYKLELSILCGLYAVMMVALGIGKRKQYLRIAAIALFGITLLKLFFYDMARSTTIAKTIVFISLGIILLIISFLYNKYKHLIIDHEKE